MFAAADQKYDSGLFELLEEDRLTVSDSVIIEIFQSLYYPNNSYEFGVIDPYIIGQIYELFLDEALVIAFSDSKFSKHLSSQMRRKIVLLSTRWTKMLSVSASTFGLLHRISSPSIIRHALI